MDLVMTYGEMPTREQFDRQWDATSEGKSTFHFGNDKRVGTQELTQEQLWEEILAAGEEYQALLSQDTGKDPEIVGSWLSSVLGCLSIEWV